MSHDFEDLPEEIQRGLMAFMREVDGEFEITDKMGMVQFIVEHAEEYPSLLKAIKIDEAVLTKHIEETGEVPPGVKAIRTRTVPGSNVTKLDIFHGPTTVPREED